MTAVVGILNKQAVAIAADSAVTIGDSIDRKIFNKANKVFSLSKFHPVGIMIYSSASFMKTPWETIIKVYRKELGEKSFPSITEYQQDFINFLRDKDFFTNTELQLVFLQDFISNILNLILEGIRQNHIDIIGNKDDKKFKKLFEEEIDKIIMHWEKNTDFCEEFIDYSFDLFESYSVEIFKIIREKYFSQNGISISSNLFRKIKNVIYLILRVKEDMTPYTGLIFTGFGEEEIYPQLVPLNISMVIDNRLRYYVDKRSSASISSESIGAVRPFAQIDVIETILTGIDPDLERIYLENFKKVFEKYNEAIVDSLGKTNPLLVKQIKNLSTEEIVKGLNEMNQQIKRKNYIEPLMIAVSNLSKEDLAEMAESLIYLTYLKRRITFSEESVGGPVDVAIISKGDGFIWIKRKHYFKPELNRHFFDNYFRK